MSYILLIYPDQETVFKTLPKVFRKHFRNTRVITDCSEIVIERPTIYKAHSQAYLTYKKHNTIKFLIGIKPRPNELNISLNFTQEMFSDVACCLVMFSRVGGQTG